MGGRKFKDTEYKGFEQGPIRPPSEAGSLLIRITRNCPWNRCTFCPVYKGSDFSLRPVEHVLEDINIVHRYVLQIRKSAEKTGKISPVDIKKMVEVEGGYDRTALNAALQWVSNGMGSIFLQDANSLIIKPERLITILIHLQRCFPWVQRVTSYAVLAAVKKGVDKKTHIRAGLKVKKAGMELSEYVMPGLGGAVLSREHALETADALNKINPDFIRLRTLTIPNHVELFDKYKTGEFRKLNGLETANELLIFLQQLDGITSSLKSDHILNLFEDLEGKFPEDKAKMVGIVSDFLNMSPTDQVIYQVGRRMGMFRGLKDMDDSGRREQVEEICNRNSITPENVDPVIDEMMKRFI